MLRSSNNGLRPEKLVERSQRVVGAEGVSLQATARAYDLPSLCFASDNLMESISGVIGSLPGSVYRHSPTMCMAVTSRKFSPPPDAPMEAIDRPRTYATRGADGMFTLRAQNALMIEWITRNSSSDEACVHCAIGPATAPAALLGSCFHLADHYQQLLELAAPHGSSIQVFGGR